MTDERNDRFATALCDQRDGAGEERVAGDISAGESALGSGKLNVRRSPMNA